ncbi:MAG TPA: amine dehydrogenase large subunit [Candidatus Binataceae bacterium]|nr:amine dehydrogenase large subunit [Candidatus Binataceae bacterium]
MKTMVKRLAPMAAILVGVALCAVAGAVAEMPPQERVTILELPPVSPHWIAASSFSGSIVVTPITLIDGDSLKVMGTITGGMTAMFAASPDRKQFYTAGTFYSRAVRGDRTDAVTIYDARKLAPTAEIVIPNKRQLAIQDPTAMGITPDGRFLLYANLTPATSVTAVDLRSNKVAGEIQTPGCAEILVLGAREFASVCADGSMLTTRFDDNGKATEQKRTARPFFDVDKDPVFALPAMIGKQAYFVSYHGAVYPMDMSSSPAHPGGSWPLLTEKDRQEEWRPGGWQPVSYYAQDRLIFVLMHRGGEWTQKKAGTEVWVFNVDQHSRVARIPLPVEANSILVTPDSKPLLFAASNHEGVIEVFSALDGKYRGQIEEMGQLFTLYGL